MRKLISNVVDINVANNFIEMTTPDSALVAKLLAKGNATKDVIAGAGWLMVRYRYMRGHTPQKQFLKKFISEFQKVRK